jgi:PAS domain S-box-containing protein
MERGAMASAGQDEGHSGSDATANDARVDAGPRAGESRYRELFDSIDEGFCVIEVLFEGDRAVDFRFLDANPAFTQQTGLADAVGRRMRELAPAHESRWFEIYGRVARSGAPIRVEGPAEALGRWYSVYAFRVGEPADRQVAILFADVTTRRQGEDAVRSSEERHRHIVEGARDYAIITTDLDGRITSWSPGAEAVLGWTPAEAVGESIDVTFVPADRAVGVPTRERAEAAAHGVAPDVRWHQRKDGDRVFIDGTMRALRQADGMLRGFLKIGQDVTRRRELDEALRSSEARYRTLLENVLDYAIFLLDADGIITEWTPGAERVKEYRPDEVLGRHVSIFYTPEDIAAGEPEREIAEAAATGRAERESWRVRKSGERFWVNEIMTAVHDADGRVIGFTKISRDLTDRVIAREAAERERLAAERDSLRRQLAAAEERERRRLARELHDQLGQHLTGFGLGLAEARRLVEAGESPEPRLAQLEELARMMARDARDLALELRPPELDDVGLESTLETYVEQWSRRYGIAADVTVSGAAADVVLPGMVSTALYRIAQEALTNVTKHAGARQVSVMLDKPDGEVQLIVEDDGRGFDPVEMTARARRDRRLGIASMQERAALVAGTLEVESSPGRGTTVYVRVPLRHNAAVSSADDGGHGPAPQGRGP